MLKRPKIIDKSISQSRYGRFESFSSKFRGYIPRNFEPLCLLEDVNFDLSFAGRGKTGSDHQFDFLRRGKIVRFSLGMPLNRGLPHTSSVASMVHFARHRAQCLKRILQDSLRIFRFHMGFMVVFTEVRSDRSCPVGGGEFSAPGTFVVGQKRDAKVFET